MTAKRWALSMTVLFPRPFRPAMATSSASPARRSKSSAMTSQPRPSRMPRKPLNVRESGRMSDSRCACDPVLRIALRLQFCLHPQRLRRAVDTETACSQRIRATVGFSKKPARSRTPGPDVRASAVHHATPTSRATRFLRFPATCPSGLAFYERAAELSSTLEIATPYLRGSTQAHQQSALPR